MQQPKKSGKSGKRVKRTASFRNKCAAGYGKDEAFMRLAIREARNGMRKGGGPFGCVIVRDGKTVAKAHNTVVVNDNAADHAEINAIRLAGRKLGTPFLEKCVIYSTGEPCPMCFAACHWARARKIVYGASIADAAKAGLNELRLSDRLLKKLGREKIVLRGGVLRGECIELFKIWKKRGGKKY